jgi:hypothetical protein
MRNKFLHSYVLMLGLLIPSLSLAEEAKQPQTTNGPPAMPEVKLESLAGEPGAGDAAFHRAFRQIASELSEQASNAVEATKKVELQLAAVNVLLSEYLEPPCTRHFYGLETRTSAGQLSADFAFVDRMIAETEEWLGDDSGLKELPEDWLPQATAKLEALRAFAQGLRAYLEVPEEQGRLPDPRDAASRLSRLLESEDRNVVAAATLWHAILRSRGGNAARGIEVLEYALTDLPHLALRYAFFARLLRCRLLAADGKHSTALALLLQVEERCYDWFPKPEERELAINAAAFLQLRILQDWYARLAPEQYPEEREWCADRMISIISDRFRENSTPLLRLQQAIPIIAEAPESAVMPSETLGEEPPTGP